jgi:hypothetical protein
MASDEPDEDYYESVVGSAPTEKDLSSFRKKTVIWLIIAIVITISVILIFGLTDNQRETVILSFSLASLEVLIAGCFYLITARLEKKAYQLQYRKYQSEKLQWAAVRFPMKYLMKMNFSYLDRYYDETHEQAARSFKAASLAAVGGFCLMLGGCVISFYSDPSSSKQTAAVVATLSGIITQFVSAVFFYLQNKTMLKMGEYHQKLVLTQNVSLAINVLEKMHNDADRSSAQGKLIESLCRDVNRYISAVGGSPEGKEEATKPSESKSTESIVKPPESKPITEVKTAEHKGEGPKAA